jgi:PKD repeat protein
LNFGDGSPLSTEAAPCHTYNQPGVYEWQAKAVAGGVTRTLSGEIKIVSGTPAEVLLTFTRTASAITIAWPATAAGFEVQTRSRWGTGDWAALGQPPGRVGDQFVVTVQAAGTEQYFRLRKAP